MLREYLQQDFVAKVPRNNVLGDGRCFYEDRPRGTKYYFD
jgi:hypothetical protein